MIRSNLTDVSYETIQIILKWRGKPVFVRHRTPEEIQDAESVNWKALRDPQPDSDRVQNPEWLVMLGTCGAVQFCLSADCNILDPITRSSQLT